MRSDLSFQYSLWQRRCGGGSSGRRLPLPPDIKEGSPEIHMCPGQQILLWEGTAQVLVLALWSTFWETLHRSTSLSGSPYSQQNECTGLSPYHAVQQDGALTRRRPREQAGNIIREEAEEHQKEVGILGNWKKLALSREGAAALP